MIVSAWKDQKPDSRRRPTYGIRIGKENRDRYFGEVQDMVAVELPTGRVLDVNVLKGFRNHCPELRDEGFRDWFSTIGKLDWEKRKPPKFDLTPTGLARFRLQAIH